MRRRRLAILFGVACSLAAAPSEVPEPLLVLTRIKRRMTQNLASLPNYTCLQTIERSMRRIPSRRFELIDTLRLEVALVSGKELFSWPGAGKFEDREISDIVGGGAIGNGNFALHAKSVFNSSAPTFTYAGEELRGDRKTLRYDYRVPQMLSGFHLRVGTTSGSQVAIVGYHGSVWADAQTHDLVRMEIHADDIPPHLQLSTSNDAMEYARVRIGESEFLLPQSSELSMIDLSGNESRNRTRFSGCRQYAGESVLSFADADAVAAPATLKPLDKIELPPGLRLEVRLEAPIDSDKAAVGDPITARVAFDVKRKKNVVVPKGSLVHGRIFRLERRPGNVDYCAVGIRFHAIQLNEAQADFFGTLEEVGPFLGRSISGRAGTLMIPPRAPEPGVFYIRGTSFKLPPGLRMVWETQAPPAAAVSSGKEKL